MHLPKAQQKALRFAWRLMRGEIGDADTLSYISGTPVREQNAAGVHVRIVNRHWIEPDTDPRRPYLNEAVFAELVALGWMEARRLGGRWTYRITPEGCAAMGWTYPLSLAHGARERLRDQLAVYRERKPPQPPFLPDTWNGRSRGRRGWREGIPDLIRLLHFKGR